MATFLDLVQRVATESGTVTGSGQPPTVTNQTGRLSQFVNWTNRAWRHIQNHRSHWLWMRDEFSGSTIAGQARYAGSDFGLPRFAAWDVTSDALTIYKTSEGQAGEGALGYVAWPDFYTTYLRGESATRQGKPVRFSVTPQNALALWPVPDADYTVRGLYRKTPQDLVLSNDVPEMPARFHDAIMYRALTLLSEADESMTQLPLWQIEYMRIINDLERDQLPQTTLAGAFA
jgi:hypothetical protein